MSPLPTLAKMLFSIHRTVWLYFNIVLGRWGLRKFNNIRYKMICHWVWVLFYVVAFILKVMLHKAIFNVDFYCVAFEIYNSVVTGDSLCNILLQQYVVWFWKCFKNLHHFPKLQCSISLWLSTLFLLAVRNFCELTICFVVSFRGSDFAII